MACSYEQPGLNKLVNLLIINLVLLNIQLNLLFLDHMFFLETANIYICFEEKTYKIKREDIGTSGTAHGYKASPTINSEYVLSSTPWYNHQTPVKS